MLDLFVNISEVLPSSMNFAHFSVIVKIASVFYGDLSAVLDTNGSQIM